MSKKAVVIGSGPGGSASAALLAKAGYEVTLLEAHKFHGGRCSSHEKDGFIYDFGVHMFSRGQRGPLGEVNHLLDGTLTWITRDPACRVMGKVEFDFPLNIKPFHRQVYLVRRLGVKPRNLAGAFRLFRILMNGKQAEEHDQVTLYEFVSRYTDDDNIHLFMNCVSQLYFALSYKEASAGEFIWSFCRMFRDAAFGYPAGGSGEIAGSYLRELERYGGIIKYNEPAVGIKVKYGQVVSVKTRRKVYAADIILSNTGRGITIDLVGKRHFPKEYMNLVNQSTYSNSYVTIKYALKRAVIPYPVVFYLPHMPGPTVFDYIRENRVPEDPYLFMPVPSNIDPSLAPNGTQLVIAGTAAPPGASTKLCGEILDGIHAKVCQLFPEVEDELIWEIRSTAADVSSITGHRTGEAIGLGQTPEQAGRLRPDHETPIGGLYLVGADAGARGIGTEAAAGSAIRLVEKLTAT